MSSADSAMSAEARARSAAEAEAEVDEDHRRRLAGDREPAETDQRVEAEAAGWRNRRREATSAIVRQALRRDRSAAQLWPCRRDPITWRRAGAPCRAAFPRPARADAIEAAAPAIDVESLTKLYKAVTAVDGISFAIPRGLDHRHPRRQRRRQDHHDRHDPRADPADLRHHPRARPRHARASATASSTA